METRDKSSLGADEMETTTVRLPKGAKNSLRSVSDANGMTMTEMLVSLIADAENKLFFGRMELGYKNLNDDTEGLASETDLVNKLDRAAMDGLGGVTHGGSVKKR